MITIKINGQPFPVLRNYPYEVTCVDIVFNGTPIFVRSHAEAINLKRQVNILLQWLYELVQRIESEDIGRVSFNGVLMSKLDVEKVEYEL